MYMYIHMFKYLFTCIHSTHDRDVSKHVEKFDFWRERTAII